MPKISAVGLFCCDKFEETPNEKVVNMSKLTKPYFSKSVPSSRGEGDKNLQNLSTWFMNSVAENAVN